MIERWILDKIEPLKPAPLIIVRDPQRMLQPGAYVVDGWARENDYTVLFCTGNVALREMYEAIRDDPTMRILLVDRSRKEAKIPLFYPDLTAQTGTRCQMVLSLRDFLVERTGDTSWPHIVNGRQLARLILANLPEVLDTYQQLRQVGGGRFSDTDLYKIVLGAALKINPFRSPSPVEIRRLCIEQHYVLDDLLKVLPKDVLETLRVAIASAPKPFCWLLERDPTQVVRAFTLAAIMRQHDLEYQILLSNLDPLLHDYREIDPWFLDQAMKEQLTADADRVFADVGDAEDFMQQDPARLAFLLRDRMQLDHPDKALQALKRERLSPVIRGMALASLLVDLIENKQIEFHTQALELLDRQAEQADLLALRRPTEQWLTLESAYRRAVEVCRLRNRLIESARRLKVTAAQDLTFDEFDRLWNQEHFNRLDYYTSDLERILRVGNILPVPRKLFWPELDTRWGKAREELRKMVESINQAQHQVDTRFQDFYLLHYGDWIRQSDAPVVFAHQFLPRVLRTHWDPQSGRKAVIMVFDGLRTDAWDELLRPVFEERFELVERRPGSSLLPSETYLSRKAISAGCLPEKFLSTRESNLLKAWLKDNLGLDLSFDVRQDSDTVDSGIAVRYVSDRLEYIVFNFTDGNLHGSSLDLSLIYSTIVREIIQQDVRSVLRELPNDALIFVISDHGFAPVPKPTVVIPDEIVVDRHDIKYRYAGTTDSLSGKDSNSVIDFDVHTMGIPPNSETVAALPIHHMLFPRPGYTLQREKGHRDPDPYTHGGLSMAECMVPVIVMGPRQAEQSALQIESIQQVGSVSEGEGLELEVTIAATRAKLPDTGIALTFSREDIPARREVFHGERTRYSIRWTPKLGDLPEESRREGVLVLPVTVILTYRQDRQPIRLSKTIDVRIKLDPARLRRRVDSKLDLLMGKVPNGLQS